MRNLIVPTIFKHLISKIEAELKIKSSIGVTIDSKFKVLNNWKNDTLNFKILE